MVDNLDLHNQLLVMNHNSPFFRLACKIDFQGGIVVGREVIGAD